MRLIDIELKEMRIERERKERGPIKQIVKGDEKVKERAKNSSSIV